MNRSLTAPPLKRMLTYFIKSLKPQKINHTISFHTI